MQVTVVRLRPRGPWRVGSGPAALEETLLFPPADTLFAALCAAWNRLWGKEALEELLAAFKEAPPFYLSSLFPRIDGTWFLPRPIGVPTHVLPGQRWVDLEAFGNLICGSIAWDAPASTESSRAETEVAQEWFQRVTTRAAIGRISLDATPYSVAEVVVQPTVELYAMVRISDPTIEDRLQAAFRLVADEGIGGERTAGRGLFGPPEWEVLDLAAPDSGPAFVTISPYYPRADEIPHLKGAYRLRERRGWVGSTEGGGLLQRGIRQFVEGSWFVERGQRGALADVTPRGFTGHRVYRYGLPFKIPMAVVPGEA